ncbi:MAG: AraC family transcriptional regulator [Eubacteriales bacterium]|nr:AraC family transcriptional regulator [Eubacteriales bacterium]
MSTNRYNLEGGAPAAAEATLRYITAAKYEGDWNSSLHTHSCAEMFYVVGGRGQFRIEDKVYPVSANDLVVINPYVMHTETSLDLSPMEYIVLGIDALELTGRESQSSQFYITSFRGGDVQFYLRDMLREMEQRPEGYETVCQAILNILVRKLRRNPDFSADFSVSVPQVSKESAIVRRYIERHFKENISLDILAEAAHINKFHLAHLYSKDYGVSPISHLLSLRIQESRYLLQSTDLPLAQIARITGFSSPSYFSQSFRRAEGISPTEYRQRCRARKSGG